MRSSLLLYLYFLVHLPLPILATRGPSHLPHLPSQPPLNPRARSARCTDIEPALVERFERQFTLDKQSRHMRRAIGTNTSQPTMNKRQKSQSPITVHFHVISGDQTPEKGNVPDEQIRNQIDAINEAFAQIGLSFVLGGVDRTENPDWFSNGGPDTEQQNEMKRALRNGGPADLNIYTVDFTGTWDGLLGYATFPQSYQLNPYDDGIVILYSSLPEGSLANFNQGKTAVHEIGHWVGLYHTFQGSCFQPGDYVADTMAEAIPSEACLEGRITCPIADLLEGESDPIHNYMDYSPDSCMNEFTPGQADRVELQMSFYRGVIYHS